MTRRYLSVILLLSLVLHQSTAAAIPDVSLQRPGAIEFAYITGPSSSNLATWAGVMAAQQEIQKLDLLQGTNFLVTYVPGVTTANSTQDYKTLLTKVVSKYFGFLYTDFYLMDALCNFTRAFFINRPIIGGLTTSSFPFTKISRNVINYRTNFAREMYQVLNYALHSSTRCTQFIVYRLDFPGIEEISLAVTETLKRMNFPPVEDVIVGDVISDANVTLIREAYFRDPQNLPNCVAILGLQGTIRAVIETLWAHPAFDREETYFFGGSVANAPIYNSSKFGTQMYQNLFFTQAFANPTDASIPSVASYQAALSAFIASNPTVPPEITSQNLGPVSSLQHDYYSYEGYMITMFAAEVLKTMTTMTPAAFINKVYQVSLFKVGETVLGPFSDRCLRSTAEFPCWCNLGSHSLSMSRVNGTTGQTLAVEDDATLGESGVAHSSVGLNTCSFNLAEINEPLNVVAVIRPLHLDSPAYSVTLMLFATAVFPTFRLMNTQNSYIDFRLIVSQTYNASRPRAEVGKFWQTLRQRYRPFLLFGSDAPAGESELPNFYGNALRMPLEDPPLKAATTFSSYDLQLTPVVADYIHTLASYIAQLRDRHAVLVMGETGQQTTLAVKSLNTFALSESGVEVGLTELGVVRAFQQALNGRVVLFVVGLAGANVASVLDWVASAAGAASAAAKSNLIVAMACDEQHFWDYRFLQSKTFPYTVNAVFASSASDWWSNTSTYRIILDQVNTPETQHYSLAPAQVRGYTGSTVVNAVTRNLRAGYTAAELMSSLYATGTTGESSVGPFYNKVCSSAIVASRTNDRECQCQKGPHRFYVHALANFYSETTQVPGAFVYTMITCGVHYVPLPSLQSSFSTGAIVGIAVGGGGGLILLIVFVMICVVSSLGRNNSNAPKDSLIPFTIAFTDIQSSTSLWGRAPLQMGESVDLHHSEIRRLVSRFHGYEVKTIGDSFMVAFKQPEDAVNFALQLQQTFFELKWPEEVDNTYQDLECEKQESNSVVMSWEDPEVYKRCWNGIRVRVGIHTGHGDVKFDEVSKGFDYYGTVVNTAARVEGVGNGGQVLITKSTYDALSDSKYDFSAVSVTDLGPQPLRGLDAPVPLLLVAPNLLKERVFAALRLDVETKLETDDSIAQDGASKPFDESMSQVSMGGDGPNVDAEAFADGLLRRTNGNSSALPMILEFYHFWESAMSTSPMKWRKDMVEQLMKKWHVTMRRKLHLETDAHYYEMMVVSLVTKISAANASKQAALMKRRGSNVSGIKYFAGAHARTKSMLSVHSIEDLPRRQSSTFAEETGLASLGPLGGKK